MTVSELAQVYHDVSGLDEYQAKTSVYYNMATHKLKQFNWFPAKAYIGAPGTGKSKSMDVDRQLVYQPYPITCHATMTPVALRDDLVRARGKTALIEEVDLYPNRKQLQAYLINRVDRIRTSGIPIKEQVETDTGVKKWKTTHLKVFGATIIHDRHSLDDMAAESRVIAISTVFREGNYIEPPTGLSLPKFTLGSIPDIFTQGRAFDTWKPLLMVASGFDDYGWLDWARLQIEEASNELKDGQAYEEKLAIFAKVIEAYCNKSGMGLVVNDPLALDVNVTEPLRKTTLPYITPQIVRKTLTKMGFIVNRHSGLNKMFTTKEQLLKVAEAIGYEDEALK